MSYDVSLNESTSQAVSIVESIDFTLRQLSDCQYADGAKKELIRLRNRLIEQIGDDVVMAVKSMEC